MLNFHRVRKLLGGVFVVASLLAVGMARAEDLSLLIQIVANGKYKVWYAEGVTRLSEDELLQLEASASAEGSDPILTTYGPARSFLTPDGTFVRLAEAPRDGVLLLERDVCSAIKAWHEEGKEMLSDEELTDLVLSAVPEGGKSISLGTRRAKAYTTQHGVMAVIWTPTSRKK